MPLPRASRVLGRYLGRLSGGRGERWSRPLYGVIAAAGLLSNAHCAWQMNRFEREEAAHFDLLLRNLPRGKRLLMLTFRTGSHIANVTPFVHSGSYYRARYVDLASFSFTELPRWPLQYQPALAPPRKQTTFWDWNPCLFRNSTDGAYYDSILTRGDVLPFASHPSGPVWTAIGGARDWKLYGRKEGAPAWTSDVEDRGPCQ